MCGGGKVLKVSKVFRVLRVFKVFRVKSPEHRAVLRAFGSECRGIYQMAERITPRCEFSMK